MKKRLIIIVCIVILFIENLPEGIITSAIEKSIVGKNEKICSNYNNNLVNNFFNFFIFIISHTKKDVVVALKLFYTIYCLILFKKIKINNNIL